MHIEWSTLALQLVNFAILVWLLQRLLYRPVLRQVDARRAALEAERVEAAQIRQTAMAERAALNAARAGVAAERAAALQAAAAQAQEAASALRAQAERDAHALMEATRKTLAEEREALLGELRRAALELAVEITRRLVAELPAELRDEPWLQRTAQHLAALSTAERAALADELASQAALQVITASALPAERAAAWRARLCSALGRDVAITFATDPTLIAGVELHLPHSVVGMGLRRVIEAVREESGARGKPE